MFRWMFGTRSAPDDSKKPIPRQATLEEDPPSYQDLRPNIPRNLLACGLDSCPTGRKLSWTPFDDQKPRWLLVQLYAPPQGDWIATLHIVAKDLPVLMRDGFYWGEANVEPEKGFMVEGVGWLQHHGKVDRGDHMTRCYTLKDGPEEKWVGFLEVCALKGPILGSFRIRELTPDRIGWACGRNPQNEDIYLYDSVAPGADYNAIYDDLSLKGWWPRLQCGKP